MSFQFSPLKDFFPSVERDVGHGQGVPNKPTDSCLVFWRLIAQELQHRGSAPLDDDTAGGNHVTKHTQCQSGSGTSVPLKVLEANRVQGDRSPEDQTGFQPDRGLNSFDFTSEADRTTQGLGLFRLCSPQLRIYVKRNKFHLFFQEKKFQFCFVSVSISLFYWMKKLGRQQLIDWLTDDRLRNRDNNKKGDKDVITEEPQFSQYHRCLFQSGGVTGFKLRLVLLPFNDRPTETTRSSTPTRLLLIYWIYWFPVVPPFEPVCLHSTR